MVETPCWALVRTRERSATANRTRETKIVASRTFMAIKHGGELAVIPNGQLEPSGV